MTADEIIDALDDGQAAELASMVDDLRGQGVADEAIAELLKRVFSEALDGEASAEVADVNGDGDADVAVADVNGDGEPDAAAVDGDTPAEEKAAVKDAGEELTKDELTSTGKDKEELGKDGIPSDEKIKDKKGGDTDGKSGRCGEETLSDVRQKNIVAALIDRRF